jgi:hypothetical protein
MTDAEKSPSIHYEKESLDRKINERFIHVIYDPDKLMEISRAGKCTLLPTKTAI